MGRSKLLDLLDGQPFYQRAVVWKPTHVLDAVTRTRLLSDIEDRYRAVASAQQEFSGLDRVGLYNNHLKSLRQELKRAQYSWRVDDVRFLDAVHSFLSHYGAIMRLLKLDQQRGVLSGD